MSRTSRWSRRLRSALRSLAPDVHQLAAKVPNAINVYLVGDVLVDAGTPAARRRILGQLEGHEVRVHVVTHAHPDHFGSSDAVCEALDVPLWTGERDGEAIETARPVPAPGRIPALLARATVVDVPAPLAALGCKLEVQTLEGPEDVHIRPGTQPGETLELRGRGMAILRRLGAAATCASSSTSSSRVSSPTSSAKLLGRLTESMTDANMRSEESMSAEAQARPTRVTARQGSTVAGVEPDHGCLR